MCLFHHGKLDVEYKVSAQMLMGLLVFGRGSVGEHLDIEILENYVLGFGQKLCTYSPGLVYLGQDIKDHLITSKLFNWY